MEIEFLKTIPFLSGLDDEDLASLAGLFTVDEVGSGKCIVEEGKPIDALYIVLKGIVHVRRATQDKQVLLGRIERGGFFGEVNLFSEGTATASIYAMDSVQVAVIDYSTFRGFMENNPAVGYSVATYMMKELASRLRKTNDRLLTSLYWPHE